MKPMKFGMGQALTRVEDQRFITGQGHYATDYHAKGELQGFVLRAPYASATFTIGDLAVARAMPGVAAVITHEDVKHLGDLPCQAPIGNFDGTQSPIPSYPVLPKDRVRHVGEAVAFIVAETIEQARDAAEIIEVKYSGLPVAADIAGARKKGAPAVHVEAPDNVAFDHILGNRDATDAIFAKAPRVVSLDVVNNRIIANYMEPRSIVVEPQKNDHLLITIGSQGVHGLRNTLAKFIFKVDPKTIRVVTPDVGGGFGTKTFMYREYPLAVFAAKALGKPVRWFGFSDTENRWEPLNPHGAARYHWLCAALQLVDRRGAATEGDLAHLAAGLQRVCDAFMAIPSPPSRAEALARGAELDRLCAGVDIQIGVNVLARDQAFSGAKLSGLLHTAGLELLDDGCFHSRDGKSLTEFVLSNLEPVLFSAEGMRGLTTQGVTLTLDVPRVADGVQVFERMMALAQRIADALGGVVVDDNRAPFGDKAVGLIRSQIGQFQGQMAEQGIPAGSPLALRLFS